MKIENHKFTEDARVVDLSARWAPNRRAPLTPDTICIHYDVCETLDGNTAAQFASGYYYHVAVDGSDNDQRLPQVRQYVPFNLQGSHAKGVNATTLGLVIVNPGHPRQSVDPPVDALRNRHAAKFRQHRDPGRQIAHRSEVGITLRSQFDPNAHEKRVPCWRYFALRLGVR